jgi:hypothetical protein
MIRMRAWKGGWFNLWTFHREAFSLYYLCRDLGLYSIYSKQIISENRVYSIFLKFRTLGFFSVVKRMMV